MILQSHSYATLFFFFYYFVCIGSHSLIKSIYQSLKEFSQSSSLFICLSLSISLFSSSISFVLVYGFKLPFPPANTHRSVYLFMIVFDDLYIYIYKASHLNVLSGSVLVALVKISRNSHFFSRCLLVTTYSRDWLSKQ